MPATKNLAIIGFFCVLGLVVYALTGEPEYTGPGEIPASVARLIGIDGANVEQVILEGSGESLTLARDAEGWIVPSEYGYRGDAAKVEQFLAQLAVIASPEKRGSSIESHPSFEIDAETGLRIRLSGKGERLPVSFTLGKIDAYDRVFVRVEDDPEVYSVTPNIRFGAGLAGPLVPDQWVDLMMTSIPEGTDIEAFRWETPEGVIELRRVLEETTLPAPDGEVGEKATMATWKVIEPETFEADGATVRALSSSLRGVRAAAAADPTGAAGFGLEPKPEKTMTIFRKGEDDVVLEFGGPAQIAEGQEGVYARQRGTDRIFMVQTWTVTNLFKQLDTMRAPEIRESPESGPPPAPAPAEPPAQPGAVPGTEGG